MLKPGKVKCASLFRLRKQKKGTDVKNRTDENFEKKVCVGMMVHHVVEDICIHGHRAHAFGQDGVSDVHSTNIATRDRPKE